MVINQIRGVASNYFSETSKSSNNKNAKTKRINKSPFVYKLEKKS